MIATTPNGTRAAIYARVSTSDQTCENQLLELHRYITARGWTGVDYVDQGISGAKDRRPALDTLLADARRDGRTVRGIGLTEHYQEIFRITRLSDFMEIVEGDAA